MQYNENNDNDYDDDEMPPSVTPCNDMSSVYSADDNLSIYSDSVVIGANVPFRTYSSRNHKARSVDPHAFRARPLPRSTFEYQPPAAAPSPPPTPSTPVDRIRNRHFLDEDDLKSTKSVKSTSAIDNMAPISWEDQARRRNTTNSTAFKARPLPKSTFIYTPPKQKKHVSSAGTMVRGHWHWNDQPETISENRKKPRDPTLFRARPLPHSTFAYHPPNPVTPPPHKPPRPQQKRQPHTLETSASIADDSGSELTDIYLLGELEDDEDVEEEEASTNLLQQHPEEEEEATEPEEEEEVKEEQPQPLYPNDNQNAVLAEEQAGPQNTSANDATIETETNHNSNNTSEEAYPLLNLSLISSYDDGGEGDVSTAGEKREDQGDDGGPCEENDGELSTRARWTIAVVLLVLWFGGGYVCLNPAIVASLSEVMDRLGRKTFHEGEAPLIPPRSVVTLTKRTKPTSGDEENYEASEELVVAEDVHKDLLAENVAQVEMRPPSLDETGIKDTEDVHEGEEDSLLLASEGPTADYALDDTQSPSVEGSEPTTTSGKEDNKAPEELVVAEADHKDLLAENVAQVETQPPSLDETGIKDMDDEVVRPSAPLVPQTKNDINEGEENSLLLALEVSTDPGSPADLSLDDTQRSLVEGSESDKEGQDNGQRKAPDAGDATDGLEQDEQFPPGEADKQDKQEWDHSPQRQQPAQDELAQDDSAQDEPAQDEPAQDEPAQDAPPGSREEGSSKDSTETKENATPPVTLEGHAEGRRQQLDEDDVVLHPVELGEQDAESFTKHERHKVVSVEKSHLHVEPKDQEVIADDSKNTEQDTLLAAMQEQQTQHALDVESNKDLTGEKEQPMEEGIQQLQLSDDDKKKMIPLVSNSHTGLDSVKNAVAGLDKGSTDAWLLFPNGTHALNYNSECSPRIHSRSGERCQYKAGKPIVRHYEYQSIEPIRNCRKKSHQKLQQPNQKDAWPKWLEDAFFGL